jgi:hypothetical protein
MATCLTVRQPWAWAIAAGLKKVENRTWQTEFRGTLLIHAGSSRAELASRDRDRWLRLMPGLPEESGLAFGAVVAVAEVLDCVRREHAPRGPFSEGPWCWLLGRVLALPEPVPLRGAQGLFPAPATVAAAVRAQLS